MLGDFRHFGESSRIHFQGTRLIHGYRRFGQTPCPLLQAVSQHWQRGQYFPPTVWQPPAYDETSWLCRSLHSFLSTPDTLYMKHVHSYWIYS